MRASRNRVARLLFLTTLATSSLFCAASARAEDDEPPLPEQLADEEFGAVARVEAPPREVTKRTLHAEELSKVPGTFGDALRAVEVLPGMAMLPSPNANPLIRGSNWQDSQVFFDGAPVPLLYHFGNFHSFVSSHLLDRVDFYPGNFSTRYGRKSGGIIEARPRDPRGDGLHGIVDVSLIDSSVLVEGPLGPRGSMALAARRSNVDLVFRSLVGSANFSTIAAPIYYDYQYIAALRPTERDHVRVMMYASSDRVELLFGKPSDDDPSFRGDLELATSFQRIQSSWRRDFSADISQEVQIAAGRTRYDIVFGPGAKQLITAIDVGGRAEWTFRLSSRVRLMAGLDVKNDFYQGLYNGIQPSDEDNTPETRTGSQKTVKISARTNVAQPAAYVELGILPWDRLQVTPGVRADWYGDLGRGSIDPRVSARYEISPSTSLKGGLGSFSQPPEIWQTLVPLGTPGLKPMRAIHASVGVDHAFSESVSASVEGFYKWLDDRIVDTPGGAGAKYDNDGTGRIFGGELSGRVGPRGPFSGILSYTISRSERSDHRGPYRIFAYDQTHILAVAGGVLLGRGWQAGATFRLGTGRPITNVVGRTYDATSDLYVPKFGSLFAARSPAVHRLDLRLEKKWTFASWSLAAYLDVQNVYNRPPVEGYRYNYDYTTSDVVTGLPILPSIGFRGEL